MINGACLLCLLAIAACLQAAPPATAEDRLDDAFRDPPAEARPFVRWWWNGDCVERRELTRELDLLHRAGIGGVEINPVGMPQTDRPVEAKSLVWLSPQWNAIVKTAIDEAAQRGMITDLIMGSGWPFGGRFLQPDEQIQKVHVEHVELTGPLEYQARLSDLVRMPGMGRGTFREAAPPELFFIRLAPADATGVDDVVDLQDRVDASDGTVRVSLPEGKFHLYVGSHQTGYRAVTHGAPGSDGPVLDHFNKAAVRKYLDRLSDALEPALGGQLGDHLRAIFCDSIELGGSNWTTDFREAFTKRNGYDPEPWLPFLFYRSEIGYDDADAYPDAFCDKLARVRYDFNNTIVELFLERFPTTLSEWAHDHGLLLRYQAYGYPWLMGMSEGYLIPDIPESNNWLFTALGGASKHGYWTWNKYASSSANLAGRRLVGCESMTNVSGVFQTTLEQIKQNDDFNFITGINHSVLHGFNYSPPEAGFPGWMLYGTYFSEHNPWWPYFHLWTEYNARLSAVFQASQPEAEVAILAPLADRYNETGLWRVPLQTKPWYAHELWQTCSQLGVNADYVCEKVIQEADCSAGRLRYGPMAYQLLIVAGAESLQPETATAIRDLAASGGRVVFIDRLPKRSPSLKEYKKNDRLVQQAVGEAVDSGAELIDAPDKGRGPLLHWTRIVLDKTGVASPVRITRPNLDLYQTHRVAGDRQVVFFSNQSADKPIEVNATVDAPSGLVPWVLLPETGERQRLSTQAGQQELAFTLQPLESALVAYDAPTAGAPDSRFQEAPQSGKPLQANWTVEFSPVVGEPFSVESKTLFDFATHADKRVRSFAGTATYRGTLRLDADSAAIDLGDASGGVTELSVNGENLGARWYGRHRYPLGHSAKAGDNLIEVRYTTTLANYTLSLPEESVARSWTSIETPCQQGVIGPVKVFRQE